MSNLMKLQFWAILIYPNWQDPNLREITPIKSFQKLDQKLKDCFHALVRQDG